MHACTCAHTHTHTHTHTDWWTGAWTYPADHCSKNSIPKRTITSISSLLVTVLFTHSLCTGSQCSRTGIMLNWRLFMRLAGRVRNFNIPQSGDVAVITTRVLSTSAPVHKWPCLFRRVGKVGALGRWWEGLVFERQLA